MALAAVSPGRADWREHAGGADAWSEPRPPGSRRATGGTDPRGNREMIVSEHGLFFGWGSTRTGREVAADKLFSELLGYWSGLKDAGSIDDYEVVMLGDHGGDLSGFVLARGDREDLARIRMAPDLARLMTRAEMVVEDVGLVDAYIDEGVLRLMGVWREAVADLA
jgi:hypothetical protein